MVIYNFLWVGFSFFIWFWLARSIRGRSQVVRMIRGVEMWSENREMEKVVQFSFCHSRVRLVRLIMKLWDVTLIHIYLFFDNQVRGRSMVEAMIIFSIVGH